jgi:hypothetical protein
LEELTNDGLSLLFGLLAWLHSDDSAFANIIRADLKEFQKIPSNQPSLARQLLQSHALALYTPSCSAIPSSLSALIPEFLLDLAHFYVP